MNSLASQLSFVPTQGTTTISRSLFRKWQVEALLNQAADLLDRCLKDRSEYDELLARKALLDIQRLQDKKRIEVAHERVVDGGLDHESKTLELQMNGEGTPGILSDYQRAEEYLQKVNQGGGIAGNTAASQIHQVRVAVAKTGAARSALANQRGWAEADKDRRAREQLKIPETLYDYMGQLMGSDGPLNYEKRLDAILIRAARDFEDAALRIVIAYEGLNDFYGFSRNGHPAPPLDGDVGLYQLDALVNWTREALSYLVAFCQLDQGWSLTFSVRSAIGEDAWKQAISTAKKSGGALAVSFSISDKLFSKHRFVRVRGVSCFVLVNKSNLPQFGNRISPWCATLSAPRKGIVTQEVFLTGAVEDVVVEQVAAGCVLNRVESRSSPRGPEVAGQVSWMNISPIAANSEPWSLSIKPLSEWSPATTDLEDCEIELVLLGRPVIVAG